MTPCLDRASLPIQDALHRFDCIKLRKELDSGFILPDVGEENKFFQRPETLSTDFTIDLILLLLFSFDRPHNRCQEEKIQKALIYITEDGRIFLYDNCLFVCFTEEKKMLRQYV